MEFAQCFQNSELSQKPLLITVFSSIKTILNYTIEELIDWGIGTMFIGVESMSDDVLEKEGLVKRKGKAEELLDQLHRHGINTLGSLVIGWDSQDWGTARADAEKFVKLNPTFYQVVPLYAVPGTRLWEQMKTENRILEGYRAETDGINDFNFETKNFTTSSGQSLVMETYKARVKEGGPWPFRMFENIIAGQRNLKTSPNPAMQNRAQIYRMMIFSVCMLAVASGWLFFGKRFRIRWFKTMHQFAREFPALAFFSGLVSPLLAQVLLIIYATGNLLYFFNPLGDQPDFVRVEYSGNRAKSS